MHCNLQFLMTTLYGRKNCNKAIFAKFSGVTSAKAMNRIQKLWWVKNDTDIFYLRAKFTGDL